MTGRNRSDARCRELLGHEADTLTDQDSELIRRHADTAAQVVVEMFVESRRIPENADERNGDPHFRELEPTPRVAASDRGPAVRRVSQAPGGCWQQQSGRVRLISVFPIVRVAGFDRFIGQGQ